MAKLSSSPCFFLILFLLFTAEVMLLEVNATECDQVIPGCDQVIPGLCKTEGGDVVCWNACQQACGAAFIVAACVPEQGKRLAGLECACKYKC